MEIITILVLLSVQYLVYNWYLINMGYFYLGAPEALGVTMGPGFGCIVETLCIQWRGVCVY